MIYFSIYDFTLILLIFLVHIFVFSDTFFDFSGCILLSLIFRQFFILPNLFLNHNFSQCIIIFPFSHSILHFSAPLHFRVSSYLRWRRIEACQDFIKTYTLAEDFSPSSRSFWRDRFLPVSLVGVSIFRFDLVAWSCAHSISQSRSSWPLSFVVSSVGCANMCVDCVVCLPGERGELVCYLPCAAFVALTLIFNKRQCYSRVPRLSDTGYSASGVILVKAGTVSA